MTTTVNGDNNSSAGGRRVRRSPEEAREISLAAARALLRSHGPAAVTLQAVARATGMTHGNVTHHFGTSSALHGALIASLSADLAAKAAEAVVRLRRDELDAQDLVDLVFAAFDASGCGRLIGWLCANGVRAALAPIFAALEGSVRLFRAGEPEVATPDSIGAGPIALEVLSHALTASLVGPSLETATAMPSGSLRRIAAERVRALRAMPPRDAA